MTDVVVLKPRAGVKGGLEKQTRYLCQAFAQKECQVTLLTTGEAPQLYGVRTISLAPDHKFTLYQMNHFDTLCQEWLKNNPYPIVFGMERTTHQTHYRAGNGVHAIYLERRKMVEPFWKTATFSINPLHRALLAKEKEAFEFPGLKKLFTNSQMVKQEILGHYQTPSEKIEVIHNGVEWEAWEGEFEKTFETKREYHPFQFLFIGNDYKRKGLLFLLQGLALLRNEDFFLTVIGKDKNLPCFQKWVNNLHLNEKVALVGPQKDILPYYRKADALVIPSIYDPFANVTVEALAMGLFVVSSRYNGGTEILTKETGSVIDELTSPESVALALKKALETPKTESNAHKIRQSVKELDLSHQLDKIVCSTLT